MTIIKRTIQYITTCPTNPTISPSPTMAAVESASTFTQPKIVGKAFTLPIVADTYSYGKE